MRITMKTKGDFGKLTQWLRRNMNNDYSSHLEHVGRLGVNNLYENTPKATGETAAGWTYSVSRSSKQTSLDFMNYAHPDASVNVAKIIDLGHGTGTGGYVPPYKYISRSVRPLYDILMDRIRKEVNRV